MDGIFNTKATPVKNRTCASAHARANNNIRVATIRLKKIFATTFL